MTSSYHDAITGKFVTKEYAEENPDTTVKIEHTDLRKELVEFFLYFRENGEDNIGLSIEEFVDKYLNGKER